MTILDLIERETNYTYRKAGSSGKEYAGVCPWCGGEGGAQGKGGRFRVWPGEGRYWCRECGRQGDDIQFLRDYKNLSFTQAKERLGIESNDRGDNLIHLNHLNHPNNHNHHNHDETPLHPPCQVWTERAGALLNDCKAALWDERGARALAWLHGRGLSDATIQSAGLGYNDRDHYAERSAWGLPPETNEHGKPKGLWLPRGVVIPWLIDGALWGLRIRRPEGDPKYYFVPGGTPNGLYNADALTPGQPAAVLEGEIDALTVCQAGFVGVATGSTYAARRTRWLARLSLASMVLVNYDTDEAGDKAAAYWLEVLPNAKRWRPYWSDANQLAQDGVNVTAWIQAGLGQQTPEITIDTEDDTGEDLTHYIGHTVSAAEWTTLQAECQRRHGADWTFYADLVDAGYHVRRLTAL